MGINEIMHFIKSAKKSKSLGRQIARLAQSVAEGENVTKTTISFSRENLKLLPEDLQKMVERIPNPTVHLGIKGGKGSSTIGIALTTRNSKPIARLALGYDTSHGAEPIIQVRTRLNLPNAENERVLGGAVFANPNVPLCEDFSTLMSRKGQNYIFSVGRGETITISGIVNTEKSSELTTLLGERLTPNLDDIEAVNKKILDDAEQPLNAIKNIFKPKKANTPKKATKTPKPVAKPKGVTTPATQILAGERSLASEVRQIMAFESEPSLESANKAKDILMKKMGYDPQLITVKFGKDMNGNGGLFNFTTGELLLNPEYQGRITNFDMADVLAHELDHFDVAIKTAKKIGLDEYEKLLSIRCSENVRFNREFYEKAMKDVDVTSFNAKPFIKELQEDNKIYTQLNPTHDYGIFLERYRYSISETEKHARNVEKKLIADLQKEGVSIKSYQPIEDYGRTPDVHLHKYYPKIEDKLSAYPPAERNKAFNDAYGVALKEINEEFYNLLTKLRTEGLRGEDCTRFDKINRALSCKEFDIKILDRVLELI